MGTVVDFHTHILPGIDDGSKNVQESIAMLESEAEQGITQVIATPHFYANYDHPKRFLERRKKAEELLLQEVQKYPELPKINVGSEVFYFRGISEFEELESFKISGSRCIMVEMPITTWSKNMYKELEAIKQKHDLTPIIAHVDRYIGVFKNHEILDYLSELPVLVQANANFFTNRLTSGIAIRYLKNDQIHLLGSDCHNMTSRLPNLGEVIPKIEKKLGTEKIKQMNLLEQKIFHEL